MFIRYLKFVLLLNSVNSYNIETVEYLTTIKQQGKNISYFGYNLDFCNDLNVPLSLYVQSAKQKKNESNLYSCKINNEFNKLQNTDDKCSNLPAVFPELNQLNGEALFTLETNGNILACYPLKILECSPKIRYLPGFCYRSANNGRSWIDLPNSPADGLCEATIDLIFVLDGSGSVGTENFEIVKDWVKVVSSGFDITNRSTQIAVILYSTYYSITVEISLGSITEAEKFNSSVDSIKYNGGGTSTAAALNKALEEFKKSFRFSKANNKKILVLVTDGQSDDKLLPSITETLRNFDVTVFAVGVGNETNILELQEIATGPGNESIYTVNDFDALNGIANDLGNDISNLALEGTTNKYLSQIRLQFAQSGISAKSAKSAKEVKIV